MAKKKDESGHDYLANRDETITIGETTYRFTAGRVYRDLPESLIEALTGGYGGLTELPPGVSEVQGEDGEWTIKEDDQ